MLSTSSTIILVRLPSLHPMKRGLTPQPYSPRVHSLSPSHGERAGREAITKPRTVHFLKEWSAKEIAAYRLTKRAPGKGRPEHDRWMKDPSAGRARCPQRAARNNQRATLDRPVQTNHLATARWIHIHENRSLSRRLCRSEAGRACPQRAVRMSADLHSRPVEDRHALP